MLKKRLAFSVKNKHFMSLYPLPEVFCKKSVKNFAKCTVKHLRQSLLIKLKAEARGSDWRFKRTSSGCF